MAQNSISCEPCRQKKCKCDRSLPICTQCSAAPSRCIYPESGKRGLPQGYITHLEHRLIDTELALYTLYTHLRRLSAPLPEIRIPPAVSGLLARQSRPAIMAEWERLPLQSPRDWERWWADKRAVFGDDAGITPGLGVEEMAGREGMEEGREETGVPLGEVGKRAEQLARREPDIYF